MATEKSIKIQKNKILTYSISKPGFKNVYGSTLVDANKDISIEMINLNSETTQYQLGDRLFGISSFVDYFTPSGSYDVDSLKYISASQTTGSGLTNIAVVKDTWLSQVEQTLSVETPRGSSNTFVFTYDGATWNLTGATTQSNVDLEDYGISFSGTATSGDVITVVETQYNKFAFFVLDANYRSNQKWYTLNSGIYIMPTHYNSVDGTNCLESATLFNKYVWDNQNLAQYPIFNIAKNLGNFILPNGIKINALVPNTNELKVIWTNRIELDRIDPITAVNPTTSYNLTNWNFASRDGTTCVYTCVEKDSNSAWRVNNNGAFVYNYSSSWVNPKIDSFGFVPIFEVPVM